MTGLVLDPVFETHDTGPGHPERADRLRSIRRALEGGGVLSRCVRLAPVEVTDSELTSVHAAAHVDHVGRACAGGVRVLDEGDTVLSRESDAVARRAAGSVLDLSRRVARGELRRGFAAVRPPGHHAERDRAMGFCLYNNVAVAARMLRNEGLARVLIADWDVHHGNGTQHLFEEDPSVFYFSVHQFPLYPGTGAAGERGRGAGLGATLNCPLPPGSGDEAFLGALRRDLTEAAEAFRPDMILVSAGFDAHEADPLASLRVTTGAFSEATRVVRDLAARVCGGKLVSVLEGGYDLDALAASVLGHVTALIEGADQVGHTVPGVDPGGRASG